jgi:hypothetical protein
MNDKIKDIKTKNDFLEFLKYLINDLKLNPEKWENYDLNSYLEGVQAWIEDMEGYYKNTNQKVPEDINWQFIANVLLAAKMYE